MINIKAVGDICPGDKLILGQGICSITKKYGVNFPLSRIRDYLSNSDLLIGNLEGILTEKVKVSQVPDLTFCGLPEFAEELFRTGFQVINLANNHVLEHGTELFMETVRHLQKAGLQICGLRDETKAYYSKPVILNKKSQKIGILAYNWVAKDKYPNADSYIAQSHDSIVNYTWHRDKSKDESLRSKVDSMNHNVIGDIKKLRPLVDVVILVPHWGFEFVQEPPFGVIKEAHSFIDAGVDLIIGIHPHMLQGYEVYKNKWIFYSLGNFVFDMKTDACKDSTILEYILADDADSTARLIPVRLNNKFQPELAKGKYEIRIEKSIRTSSDKITSSQNESILSDDVVYREFEKSYNKRKIFTIMYHFQAIFHNPHVLKVIIKKIGNFIELILLRLKGKKVRW